MIDFESLAPNERCRRKGSVEIRWEWADFSFLPPGRHVYSISLLSTSAVLCVCVFFPFILDVRIVDV